MDVDVRNLQIIILFTETRFRRKANADTGIAIKRHPSVTNIKELQQFEVKFYQQILYEICQSRMIAS